VWAEWLSVSFCKLLIAVSTRRGSKVGFLLHPLHLRTERVDFGCIMVATKEEASTKQAPNTACCPLHLVPCLAYSLAPKTGATCSSEMSANFHWTTRRYIPEDKTLRLNNNLVQRKRNHVGDCNSLIVVVAA
jgi:hypothetical protein